jgi:transketolase
MPTTKELQEFSTQVRRDIVRMVHAVNSGHPGGSLGCAEFLTVLYQDIMDYSTDFDMNGVGEDL